MSIKSHILQFRDIDRGRIKTEIIQLLRTLSKSEIEKSLTVLKISNTVLKLKEKCCTYKIKTYVPTK
jgi:hypothetical protein